MIFVALWFGALHTSCFSTSAFSHTMRWQKTFETALIRVFRAMNVLSLWDGTHFFGDNCPSNGCSMYHVPTSVVRPMLIIIAAGWLSSIHLVLHKTRISSWLPFVRAFLTSSLRLCAPQSSDNCIPSHRHHPRSQDLPVLLWILEVGSESWAVKMEMMEVQIKGKFRNDDMLLTHPCSL